MVTQDFKVTKLAILVNMKVFTFVKDAIFKTTANLSYEQKCSLNCGFAALQYVHPMPLQHFLLMAINGPSLQHQSTSLNRLVQCFFSSYTTHIQIHNTTMPTFCQAN